jgi:hypothetical protein
VRRQNYHVEPRQINQRLANFSLQRGSRASLSSRRFERGCYFALLVFPSTNRSIIYCAEITTYYHAPCRITPMTGRYQDESPDNAEIQSIIMHQRPITSRHSNYQAHPQYSYPLLSQQIKSKNLHTASNQAGISQAIALPHWIKRFSPPPSPTTQKLWNTLGNLGITWLGIRLTNPAFPQIHAIVSIQSSPLKSFNHNRTTFNNPNPQIISP